MDELRYRDFRIIGESKPIVSIDIFVNYQYIGVKI